MTQNNQPPEWLTDIQNRSWEPEIIISGLIITSLFLIQKSVFNLHASFIQDLGINPVFVNLAYNCITIGLTSLKITIIVHLAMRSLWVGAIGLSYVFPNGVNKSRLNKKEQRLSYDTPLEMTIRLEKICSLLFSLNAILLAMFIFAACLYLPFSFIFMWIDSLFHLSFWITTLISLFIFMVLVNGVEFFLKKYRDKIPVYQNMMAVLKTNQVKVIHLSIIIVILAIIISSQEIMQFQFKNQSVVDKKSMKYSEINPELYESRRHRYYRIAKASIQSFNIKDNTMALFISSYREDHDLFKRKDAFIKFSALKSSNIGIPDLYTITIDGTEITQPHIFKTHHRETGQAGYEWIIPIDTISPGIHTLSIAKAFLNHTNSTYDWKKNWESIIFNKLP